MTCTEFEELSGAYALDALTPEEQKEADEHLATCMRCTRLVQELRAVVDLLPLSVPQVEPSIAVKERILSADAVAVSLEPGPLATQAAPVGPVVAAGSLHGASASTNTEHYSIEE